MDTTYWGRNFGVTLFKDAINLELSELYAVKVARTVLNGEAAAMPMTYITENETRTGLPEV